MKILQTEIKRSIISKKFVCAVLLGILAQVITAFLITKNVIVEYINGTVEIDALNNMLSKDALWYFSTNSYVFIIPLICCIPYTVSLLTEENSTFINFIKIRTSYKNYIIAKIVSCFFSGFMTIFISSAVFLLIISCTPYVDPNSSISVVGFMSDLFTSHKNIYLLIYIIICSLMGGTYSLIGLAISTKFNNTLIALITPTIYYYVGSYIFGFLELVYFEPASVNAYFVRPNVNGIYIFAQLIIYTFISIFIIMKKADMRCSDV